MVTHVRPPDPRALGELVDALAPLIGLPIDPAHRAGVAENLARLLKVALLVTEFPLDDGIEAAPIFRP